MTIITIFNWILVLIMICFGIRFSYTDLKYKKVYNKDLLLFFIFSLIIILLQTVIFYYEYHRINIIQQHLLRGVIGITIGYLFWMMGLWSAADGKLFGTYSFAIPGSFLIVTSGSSLDDMMGLLSNILVIISTVVIISNLKKFNKKDIINSLKILKPKVMAFSLVGVFGLVWLLRVITKALGIKGNILLTAIFLVIIIGFFKIIFKMSFKKVIILIVIARLIFDYPHYLSIKTLINTIQMFLLYVVIRMVLIQGLFTKNIIKKKVDDLCVGDYLAVIPIKEKNQIKFRHLNFFSFYNYLTTAMNLEDFKILFDYDPAIGIEKNNIEDIKKVFKEKNNNEVMVFQTMAFAPYIVIGFIIAIISRGDGFVLLGILIKSTLWKLGLLKI